MRGALAALATLAVSILAPGGAAARDAVPAAGQHRKLMEGVRNWGYQLQKLDLAELSQSPFDLLVIDHAPDRVESVELMFRRAEIAGLKQKPDGSRRLVLAYISIGEAERYRFYWDEAWVHAGNCPAWLGPVNPQWIGNYPVEYWQPQWQQLIFGASDSYVDRVLEAGFDGLYLDRADVYEQFKSKPDAKAAMTGFLARLIDHARTLNPDAVVVLQNAEELARVKSVRDRLDGIAKESLYFNADKGEIANAPAETADALADLRLARRFGLKVMAVEYLNDAEKAHAANVRATHDGVLMHVTERSLSTLNVKGAAVPAQGAAASLVTPAGVSPQPNRASPCG